MDLIREDFPAPAAPVTMITSAPMLASYLVLIIEIERSDSLLLQIFLYPLYNLAPIYSIYIVPLPVRIVARFHRDKGMVW
jgi:hypothetical protein